MIFIIAPTSYEGTKFAMDAHLRDEPVRIAIDVLSVRALRFCEEDEIYILDICIPDIKRAARVVHDASWPRPHIFKEVSRVRAKA